MYSLNVPLPGSVTSLASRLGRELHRARARPRDEHTLVAKRLGSDGAHLAAAVDDYLTDVAPFELQIRGVGLFETAATGTSPVTYLEVYSPGLQQLHQSLCDRFDPVDGVEGDDYVAHVTIARGGDLERARRVADRDVDSIRWTAEELLVWDSERNVATRRLSLPR